MALYAITGGAGFLGLHLARRLLADGHAVRTLDVVPLDDPPLEGVVEEIRGDVRDRAAADRFVEGDPLVGVGHYGQSKIAAEDACRRAVRAGQDVVVIRPKTFVGPERLGVFAILFDWVRDGR